MKIAAIGECLIELSEKTPNTMALNYAGDTYNTLYYLASLNPDWQISYLTALGDDPYSQAMLKEWQLQGIDHHLCLIFADKLPGLYLIKTDTFGERTFYYYRKDSAASQWLKHPDSQARISQIANYDCIYLSGISFAILQPDERVQLLDKLKQLKIDGVHIFYDNNYRCQLWQDKEQAMWIAEEMTAISNVFFVTHTDEKALYGDLSAEMTYERYQKLSPTTLVVKDGANPCWCLFQGQLTRQKASAVTHVIDTTGAGDAFNAGFLHGFLQDWPIESALSNAHELAGRVIQTKGAIVVCELA